MVDEKQHAHELIDRLPSHQLSAVVGLLESIVDALSQKLAAAPSTMSLKPKRNAGQWSVRKSGFASVAAEAFLTRSYSRTSV